MIERLADVTVMLPGGYKRLDRADVMKIFKESL